MCLDIEPRARQAQRSTGNQLEIIKVLHSTGNVRLKDFRLFVDSYQSNLTSRSPLSCHLGWQEEFLYKPERPRETERDRERQLTSRGVTGRLQVASWDPGRVCRARPRSRDTRPADFLFLRKMCSDAVKLCQYECSKLSEYSSLNSSGQISLNRYRKI